MTEPFLIKNVHQIFNGVLKIGALKSNPAGRKSDALVYFTEGKTTYKFNDKDLFAEAETIVYLPQGSVYEMHITQRSKYICVDFEFENTENKKAPELYKNLPSSVMNEFMKLFYNRNRLEPWGIPETFSSVYKIYAAALRSKYKSYSKSNTKATDAIKCILQNYTDTTLSVADISKNVGLSETHLRRLIKSKLNMSPIQYITHLRIEKAKNMLQSTNCMISEIAYLCGFADQYYFSREFKATVGITPTEYRKEYEK